jgi:hypothetical protein
MVVLGSDTRQQAALFAVAVVPVFLLVFAIASFCVAVMPAA